MTQFEFEGVKYEFDANHCYNNGDHILLPDGRILKVRGWYESYPPKPSGLELVFRPTATPARKVENV